MAPVTRSRARRLQETADATPTTAATTPATAATNSENNAQSQNKGRGRPRKAPLKDNPPSSGAAAADSAPVRSSTRANRGRTAAATTTKSAPRGRPKKDSSNKSKVDAAVAAAVDRAKAEKEKEKEKKLKEKEKEQARKLKEKEREKEKKLKEKEKEKERKLKEKEKEQEKKLKEKEKEKEQEKKLKEKEKEKERKLKEKEKEQEKKLKEKEKEKEQEKEQEKKLKEKEKAKRQKENERETSNKRRKTTITRRVNTDGDVSDAAIERALTALVQKMEKTNRPNADDDDEDDDDEWTEDEAENLGMNLPRETMIGQYKLRCAEVEDQWPDDAKRLKMAIITHKKVDAAGVGLMASFHLGIVEGTMLLAGSVEAVQKIRNYISKDVLIPIKRPNFDIDGERPEDYEPRHNRLFIRWRGKETGEGSVSTDNYYDKNNGYIDFITPQEGSQDNVKIKGIIDDVEGIGGPLTFEGERVMNSGGKQPPIWENMGEYEAFDTEPPGMIVWA